MRRVEALLALAAMLLAGCQRPVPDTKGIDADNPLEVSARKRGVVRAEPDSPAGVFERRHDLGRDAMCVVPDGAARWRFALTASFGASVSCVASGAMVREGDDWRMRFSGAEGCEALVHEEGDELRLPGRLPPQCARLCPNRASLSGLRLPRASWSVDDARGLQIADRRGNMSRPCAG